MTLAQIGAPTEEEVKEWAWHSDVQNVDDEVLRVIGDEHISFAFTLHVSGCPVQEACGIIPEGKGTAQAQGAMRCVARWHDCLSYRVAAVLHLCGLLPTSGPSIPGSFTRVALNLGSSGCRGAAGLSGGLRRGGATAGAPRLVARKSCPAPVSTSRASTPAVSRPKSKLPTTRMPEAMARGATRPLQRQSAAATLQSAPGRGTGTVGNEAASNGVQRAPLRETQESASGKRAAQSSAAKTGAASDKRPKTAIAAPVPSQENAPPPLQAVALGGADSDDDFA